MDNIIPFPKKTPEDNEKIYSFSINLDNYLLIFSPENKEVSYTSCTFTDEGDILPDTLPMEKVQELFEQTYHTFFLHVSTENNEEKESYVLLLQFDFEGEEYGLYYHEHEEGLPLLLFKIKEKKVHKIDNPFMVKRIIRYVEETFDIEWF